MSAPLKFSTKINTTAVVGLQVAVTHFGTEYALAKDGRHWSALVTIPARMGFGSETEPLVRGASYARAKKACQDDYNRNGGR